ncbi:hypothetical protein CDQ92_11030 [Sphingopyxis bauzanensis]|uniref:Uncharacterized protein n=1 Tax=Sphingopyxis bauzanensis TaxID=651663 RepID=A0A246JX82_9SPHN|nr:hypothetical protein [Sphingopyxis bauzanensis]OWQ97536.1 hypothetical protein CDQ92_11030 [Sphingopyxis bauzanensis]GGJ56474.1 hypothetical protein GCM10011393_28350 [Sphingopyxis bauzanensis]
MTNPQKLKWYYWFQPNTSWFGSFARNFVSPDVVIWPEETEGEPQYFAWTSPHFNDAATPEDLADRSAALKAVFDGAMYLAYGSSYFAPPLTNLTDENDRHATFRPGGNYLADVRVEPFSPSMVGARNLGGRDPFGHAVSTLLFLARYDQVTKNLLKFVGVQKLTYVTLYAFKDWMSDDKWDDKRIAKEAGWSNAKFGDFTATANNPAYLGPFCRHGGSSQPPSRPMPLAEAEDPMRKAAMAFLSERGRSLNIAEKWKALIK